MNLTGFILISFLYFLGSSTAWTFGVGYYTLYRPVIAGLFTGWILGDAMTGMIAGAIVNIVYLDFVSTGGSLKGDPCLTGIIAAMVSILSKANVIEALAIAFPFGFIGILIWKYRLKINIYFVKGFEKIIKSEKNHSIFLYNALLPQLLLLLMSTLVFFICILLFGIAVKCIDKLQAIDGNYLLLVSLFLIFNSIISNLIRIRSLKPIALLSVFTFIAFFIHSDILIYTAIIAVLSIVFFDYGILAKKDYNKKNGNIGGLRLFISWAIWMNFSHACYNFERMQGLAFAHMMDGILFKLYPDEDKRKERLRYYTEFFNSEPNLGTPIHGCVIALEEDYAFGKTTVDINNLKRNMMGVVSGLGDSFTQTVLTPVFILLCVYSALSENIILLIISAILLSFIIICISYTGFMNGYFIGKSTLIDRINKVKNNKLKKYFSLIFAVLLGMVIGRFTFDYSKIFGKAIAQACIIAVFSIIYQILSVKKINEKYLIIFLYILPAFIDIIIQ